MEGNKKAWILPVVFIVLLAIIAALLAALLLQGRNAGNVVEMTSAPAPANDSGFKVGYATEGVTEVEDPEALQRAIDEAFEKAKEPGVALSYRNDAVSANGVDFDCYIANSTDNAYDMFIDIYADQALTDEIFLSELLRPGQAFEKITLKHPLNPGTHRVYVAFTQVKVEDGEQKIHQQVMVTMDFHVAD
jgi:hypothetical protein